VWVDVRQPGCYCGDVVNAPLTVTISVSPTDIVGLTSAQVTIPTGQYSTYYTQQTTVGTPTRTGTYVLTAAAPGFDSVTSGTVTVTP
jgi:hypothetical protein